MWELRQLRSSSTGCKEWMLATDGGKGQPMHSSPNTLPAWARGQPEADPVKQAKAANVIVKLP